MTSEWDIIYIYIGVDHAGRAIYGTNTASVTWHHPASQNGSR